MGVRVEETNEIGIDPREQLMRGLPATERRLELAAISTAFLEAGKGTPVVLLHEQGQFAAQWIRVIPGLLSEYRVIAPDLPGHGASRVNTGELGAARVLAWLAELIELTCTSPPAIVGHMGGGALAARFAVEHGEKLSHLVLVDSFGLGKFRPAPRFALSLLRYLTRPNPHTYRGLMRRCTVDFDAVRGELGNRWQSYEDYTINRARSKSGRAALRVFMKEVALPKIPSDDLAAIAVPTTLIWGRRDPAMKLRVAEEAAARYGWPLHVIDDAGDDPPIEQPGAFLAALRSALSPSDRRYAL